MPSLGGKQITSIINEAGLYKLIMRSNKPVAQRFQEAVCEEILPSLRKKGEYKIQSIIDKNKELEEEKLILQNEKEKIEDEKNVQIKILEDKIVDKQKRVRYKDFWKEFIDHEKNIIEDDDKPILEPENISPTIKDKSEINYNKYTIVELKNLVKEKGIKGYSKLKKQELIELLGK